MKILADTHIILWGLSDPVKLPLKAWEAMTAPANEMVFSLVSIWEITIKHMLKKPGFDADPAILLDALRTYGWSELGLTAKEILRIQALERLHTDPFDRLLMAQVCERDMPLMTADTDIHRYSNVPLIRV